MAHQIPSSKNNSFLVGHSQETKNYNLPIIQVRSQTSRTLLRNVCMLIVKVTHRCNLNCLYCYENIVKGSDMSLDTFKSLVNQVISSTHHNSITFLFHGGEPSLMNENWFSEAVTYARSKAQSLQKIVLFAIQTNLIGLDESKLVLFRDLGIKVSASLDGPSDIPDPLRQQAGIAAQKFIKAVERGLRPSVLMTINHSNFHQFRKICQWLEYDMGVRSFKANVMSAVGRGINISDLEPEQVFEAYRDILEYMIETNGEGVIEDNLTLELIKFFASPEERSLMPIELCRSKRCGAGNTVIGVTPQGDFLPCGRFQWNDKEHYLGSLNDPTPDELLPVSHEVVERFHDLVPENWYNCSSCEANHICSFGCQAFIVRSKSRRNVDCIPTKMRFKYYSQNHQRLESVIGSIRDRRLREQSEQTQVFNYGQDTKNGYANYSDHGVYFDYYDRR